MASIYELLTGQPEQQPQATPIDWNNVQGGSTQPGILNQAATGGAGILDSIGFKTDNFGGRLANGLMAAGSRDPAQTLLELKKGDALEANANKPKITPLADGAFSLVSYPDGSTKIVRNDEVSKYLQDSEDRKVNTMMEKIRLQNSLGVDAATKKQEYKENLERAGGPQASTEFSPTVTSQIDKINTLEQAIGSGNMDSVKTPAGTIDSPVISNIVDQTWGRVAGTKDYSLRRDLDSLIGQDVLVLAQGMKGALSDKDVAFLKSIQPKTDDPMDRKMAYLKELKDRLQRGEEARISAAKAVKEAQGEKPSEKPSAPAASINPDQVKSAFGSYEPDVYEYRIFNGTIQRKKK